VRHSTFYGGCERFLSEGFDGLHDKKRAPGSRWNAIPKPVRDEVLKLALTARISRRVN
jgi:hypothetical protein